MKMPIPRHLSLQSNMKWDGCTRKESCAIAGVVKRHEQVPRGFERITKEFTVLVLFTISDSLERMNLESNEQQHFPNSLHVVADQPQLAPLHFFVSSALWHHAHAFVGPFVLFFSSCLPE